ncbi:MAG TPA: glycosyl hydrolase 115 family protein [Bacteroidales bacterium]|jgi:hypothetical protein|nr:glycosyl hydrolase 115 family protein [Bacteroidales bacterium]
MNARILLFSLFLYTIEPVFSQSAPITVMEEEGGFPLFSNGEAATLCISADDYSGAIRAFKDLQTDLEKVTGKRPSFYIDRQKPPRAKYLVIAGTIGKSNLIDYLIRNNRIDTKRIEGEWESYSIQVVSNPWPKVKEALVIIGSDKRGTIYGIYDLCAAIGVSPWYWWADVPVDHKNSLFLSKEAFVQGPPAVKYRGIFLNDEHPNLTNWITGKFGTVKPSTDPPIPQGIANYNSQFYTKLFELILRLKGNYLWPAMWNNAFNEDDPENARLAEEYGIVMGTSHQEPMLRAQKEWDRRYQKTLGSWNYAKYPDTLLNFWRKGISRNKNFESIITIGLRGANDTEMAPGGPEANMAMLEEIVNKQRKIISEEINPDVTKVPQLWCLYKEVQEYYNAGMRVPDDVTLLWAEDNWGNIRRVPSVDERNRSGGAGIYYHFDYHGGPRSYQWINTSPLPKIWDQLTFARQYGADRIWIVNVGHFKAYSLPIQYFLDLAFYGDSLRNDNISAYLRSWAIQQFGKEYSVETAEILAQHTRFNGRRKPELLSPSTYSLVHYNEAENVVKEYNDLAKQAEEIYYNMPPDKKDAYYQLVYFPVKASALVNKLYFAAAKNNLYGLQNRAGTNDWSMKTEELFRTDTSMMGYFNRVFAGGKWNHFMDQPHLGYNSWRDPPVNSLRHITLSRYEPFDPAQMGVSIEGSEKVWPETHETAILPEFDIFNRQSRFIDIFNKGKTSFEYKAICEPWIILSENSGLVEKEIRIMVRIDWAKVPEGRTRGSIDLEGTGRKVKIMVNAFNPPEFKDKIKGFIESNGYVSMEAAHYGKIDNRAKAKWIEIEDFGHTVSGMRATAATDIPALTPGNDSPCIEYNLYLFSDSALEVNLFVAPTLNFLPGRPMRYGISFDNQELQIITLVAADFDARNGNRDWEKTVSDNYRIGRSKHAAIGKGNHVLKIWMIDPGVVVQKLVVNTGGLKPSYLGPPESFLGK